MPVDYPICMHPKKDCTACIKGNRCAALKDADMEKTRCPFYRSKAELTQDESAKYKIYLGTEAKYV